MAAAQKRCCANEFPRWVVLGLEVAHVDGIKFVEQRQISAGNLDIHQIVHRHSCLSQSPLQAVEHQLDFIFDFRWRLSGFWVQPDSSGQVQGIPSQYPVAERRLYRLLRRIKNLAHSLRRGLRKCPTHTENSCKYECYGQKSRSAIHALPPFESLLRINSRICGASVSRISLRSN